MYNSEQLFYLSDTQTLTHTSFSPSYLCSILQTWRWACEGSGSTFGQSLSLVWIGEKQRDRMWCHLGQWLSIHHNLPSQDSFPRLRPSTTPPPTPPLFLSTSLLSCFFSRSKWWLCYIHQFFLCNHETVQRNQIETSRRRTLCIFAYSVYETVHTLQSQRDVSAFCIISRSSCPKTKGQYPIYPKVKIFKDLTRYRHFLIDGEIESNWSRGTSFVFSWQITLSITGRELERHHNHITMRFIWGLCRYL